MFFEDKNLDGCITTEADTSGLAVEVLQRLWYYPFGLQMENLSTWDTEPGQAYRYNGKERDTLSGWYEYGFRWYDAGIGRFTGVDPIADQFPWVSVFNYAENDPIRKIDLHGLQGVVAPVRPSLRPSLRPPSSVNAPWNTTQNIDAYYQNSNYPSSHIPLSSSFSGKELYFSAAGSNPEADDAPVIGNTRAAIAEQVKFSSAEDEIRDSKDPVLVYRALREGEDPSLGILANDINAGNTPQSHVAGLVESQWISTSKSALVAGRTYRGLSPGGAGVVAIDLRKVSFQVLDISNGFPNDPHSTVSKLARRDKEVLIKGYIPATAIIDFRKKEN